MLLGREKIVIHDPRIEVRIDSGRVDGFLVRDGLRELR